MTIRPANHLSEEELKQRIDSEKDADKRDKYKAILWIRQGKKRIDVAKELGVKRLTIFKWIIRYNREGEQVSVVDQDKVTREHYCRIKWKR